MPHLTLPSVPSLLLYIQTLLLLSCLPPKLHPRSGLLPLLLPTDIARHRTLGISWVIQAHHKMDSVKISLPTLHETKLVISRLLCSCCTRNEASKEGMGIGDEGEQGGSDSSSCGDIALIIKATHTAACTYAPLDLTHSDAFSAVCQYSINPSAVCLHHTKSFYW